MVDAAQPAFLVAPIDEWRLAVGAQRLQDANVAVGVSEHDEIFAQDAYLLGRPVRLGQVA